MLNGRPDVKNRYCNPIEAWGTEALAAISPEQQRNTSQLLEGKVFAHVFILLQLKHTKT